MPAKEERGEGGKEGEGSKDRERKGDELVEVEKIIKK